MSYLRLLYAYWRVYMNPDIKSIAIQGSAADHYRRASFDRKIHDIIADVCVIEDNEVKPVLAGMVMDQMVYWMARHGIPDEVIVRSLSHAGHKYLSIFKKEGFHGGSQKSSRPDGS